MPRRERKRPKSPLLITMGIVCLVTGGLGLICGLCGTGATVIMTSAGQSGPMADYFNYMDAQAPAWRVLMYAKTVGQLLLAFVVLAAGIGLLMRQRWARWVAVVYAALVIPLHLVHVSYDLAVVIPAGERYINSGRMAGGAPPPGQQAGTKVGTMIGAFIWVGSGAAILVAMLVPAMGVALRPAKPVRDDERDFDDEEDDWDRDDDDRGA